MIRHNNALSDGCAWNRHDAPGQFVVTNKTGDNWTACTVCLPDMVMFMASDGPLTIEPIFSAFHQDLRVVTVFNQPGDEGVAYTLRRPYKVGDPDLTGYDALISETGEAYFQLAGIIDDAFPPLKGRQHHA